MERKPLDTNAERGARAVQTPLALTKGLLRLLKTRGDGAAYGLNP